MSNDHPATLEPIAVDPAYRLRDNQFWYSDCTFADRIRERGKITLRIAGLGVRDLTHARPGSDGRPTYSYKLPLPNKQDRAWWKKNGGERVRVELLSIEDNEEPISVPPLAADLAQLLIPREKKSQPIGRTPNEVQEYNGENAVLCMGLDIAWFGGSKGNRDSQYDCLAAVLIQPGNQNFNLQLHRVPLENRDPSATQLLDAVDVILEANHPVEQVIFALDAPIQAEVRERFGVRQPVPSAGTIERRACENWLSKACQRIDKAAGGANQWQPNIQPGAPLAPRVEHLLNGLQERGFDLWTPAQRESARLVIECFPAEAIWAMKRNGFYLDGILAKDVKAYKFQKGNHLKDEQVQGLVRIVLDAFGSASAGNEIWNRLVDNALTWMLNDQIWQTPEGLYRGGKLLDDVVDTMICLATSLSYLHRQAHVWCDTGRPSDGHIIGPGFKSDGLWAEAWPCEERENAS